MKRLLYILTGMHLIILSCTIENEDIITSQPGYFVLTELRNNLESYNYNKLKSLKTGFELGDIKASKEFFFLLTNGGDQPIFDIQLVTDNEQFIITPKKIDKLEGSRTNNYEENAGFIPIITLGINHGTQINGVGYTDLLPMNINTSLLTISGKTIKNNDTITISSEFDFSVDVKIMDIKLYVQNNEIDLTSPSGGVSTTLGGLGFMRFYSISSDNIEFENTGNVPINLTYGQDDNQQSSIIEQDIKKQLTIKSMDCFILDGNGTITDNNRIQLGNDGKGYFTLLIKFPENNDTTGISSYN
jgi:hypothetical protein